LQAHDQRAQPHTGDAFDRGDGRAQGVRHRLEAAALSRVSGLGDLFGPAARDTGKEIFGGQGDYASAKRLVTSPEQ
jgi:hypothetical protein